MYNYSIVITFFAFFVSVFLMVRAVDVKKLLMSF